MTTQSRQRASYGNLSTVGQASVSLAFALICVPTDNTKSLLLVATLWAVVYVVSHVLVTTFTATKTMVRWSGVQVLYLNLQVAFVCFMFGVAIATVGVSDDVHTALVNTFQQNVPPSLEISTYHPDSWWWSSEWLSEAAVYSVGEALKRDNTTTSLSLNNKLPSGHGVEHIASALVPNHSLRHLDVSDNSLGDRGAMLLADGLRANSGLISVNLAYNGIGDESVVRLSTVLQHNQVLKRIDLSNNRISDEGLNALVRAIIANPQLHKVDLTQNMISVEALQDAVTRMGKRSTVIVSDKVASAGEEGEGNGGWVILFEILLGIIDIIV